MHSITLDLETRRLASEVGGWDALKRGEGGCSALVLWVSAVAHPRLFDDHSLSAAVDLLEKVPVIITFNGASFDIPVIEGLFGRKLRLHAHFDLLQTIWSALADQHRPRKGYTLDDVAFRTLGKRKSGSGLHAPALSDAGEWGALFDYCLGDVLLTRELAQFAQKEGGIIDTHGELLLLDLPEWFEEVNI